MIENHIVGIVGPKGSGKTHLASRMFGAENRAFLYQPARMNSEADAYATHESTGDLDGLFAVINREETFRCVYKVPDSDFVRRGQNLIYTSVLSVAMECYAVGNLTLYLDEAHELCNQYSIDPELRRIIRLARNNQLSLVWISQSMEVHREIRRNTDEYYFYRIFEPGDLDKVNERCGPVTANKVANLRRLRKEGQRIIPGEFLIWSASNA